MISTNMFFCLEQSYSKEENEKVNLVYGGDFERTYTSTENLWDGVDRSNRLRMIGNSAPVVVDINGDGKKDIICGDRDWMLWYYLNSGTNESPEFTRAKFIKARFDSNVKPVVVDWNGDARKDILFGSSTGRVYYLKNERAGSSLAFADPETISLGGVILDIGQFSAPAVADWNGDRKKDLILGEGTYSANSVYVYLNSGTNSNPKFDKDSRQYLAYGDGRMHLTPCVVDWDKDGDLDLVVGDEKGYINLYLNRAEKGQDIHKEEKVKVLECAGRIKAGGQDIDVSSYSTPFVVDWDEDGDWDMVVGNSLGYIYLILNQGTLDKPNFTQPTALKGVDTYKPMKRPSYYWNQDAERKGAYYTIADEDAYSGKYALKVICYDGYDGEVTITVSYLRSSLERDVGYELNFYTKGKDTRGTWAIGYGGTSERTIADGRRTFKAVEQEWSESGEFKPGFSWRRVTGRFKLPKIENKDLEEKLEKKKACSLTFKIEGKGSIWIDQVTLTKK